MLVRRPWERPERVVDLLGVPACAGVQQGPPENIPAPGP